MSWIVRVVATLLVGLPTTCVAGLLAPFLFWGQTDKDTRWTDRYGDAFCEMTSSLGRGRFTRESAAIIDWARVSRDGETLTLDFRAIDEQWELLCLTSTVSGDEHYQLEELFSLPRRHRMRDRCWESSSKYLMVNAIRRDGGSLPLKFPIERLKPAGEITTDYTALSKSVHGRQCSPRATAVATCRPVMRRDGPICLLTFSDGN
jgi:hypothetical protein